MRVRQQDTVRLHFEQFDLGEGDWVKVYDGSKSKVSEIIRWDSYASPVDVVSSGHKMVVEFRSNACGEKSGIHAVMEINSKKIRAMIKCKSRNSAKIKLKKLLVTNLWQHQIL